MEWSRLLTGRRRTNPPGEESHKEPGDERTQFERDFDRVIFLSSFRRLQDKAQVFPLEASDFVRTRLTHSVEVSTLGRSLANDVGRRMVRKKLVDEGFKPEDMGAIVATTSLVHDLGNPPFGHFGESAIRDWFEHNGKYIDFRGQTELSSDFLKFEGNAQAFRILTRLQMHRHDKGANLTYATLSSSLKYTCPSSGAAKGHPNKAFSKPGYFMSEADVFEDVIGITGTGKARHPLVYLMEAADDIANSTIDIEDAVKKGLLSFSKVMEDIAGAVTNTPYEVLAVGMEEYRAQLPDDWPEPDNTCIQELRIRAQTMMFRACSDAFMNNYAQIMNGSFQDTLIGASEAARLYDAFIGIAKRYVYATPSILTMEYLGKEVIHGLMDRFVPAVLQDCRKQSHTVEGKLYHLISPSFRYIEEHFPSTDCLEYNRVQLVTDFICGMTDSYALNLYQRLIGVKL